MINYHVVLSDNLKRVLPTHYERTLKANTKVPCISYMELNNYDSDPVFSLEDKKQLHYSHILYQIKIWGNSIAEIQEYINSVDVVMKRLGFKRISSNEMFDSNSTIIQKILVYEALASEEF